MLRQPGKLDEPESQLALAVGISQTFQQFAEGSQNRTPSFEAYERAASLATVPMGGIWPEGETVMNLEETSGIWQRLLREG